jgi:hypothetical protein
MKFKEYITEKETPDERAQWRLKSFEQKAGGDDRKLSAQINNRTGKTTKPEKLDAWIKVLQQNGYRDEANRAKKRKKELGI